MWEWLRGRGQAQWGTAEPRGVDRGGIAWGNTEGTQTSEEVRDVAGVRDCESSGGAGRRMEKPRNLEAMEWALAW